MTTLSEAMSLGEQFLAAKGFKNPKKEIQELYSAALELKKIDLYLHHDRPLDRQEILKLRRYLERRSKGEPLAYIHGEVEFYGCRLRINPFVLIPRQETEILVDKIAPFAKKGELWDICTGSGAIGIALKKKNPDLNVTLSDISEKALLLAQENAILNQVDLETKLGDMLKPFQGKADFIVSNPPYISDVAYESLDREVKFFEPKSALRGGLTGLEFYEVFAEALPEYLKPGGSAWFEIGFDQGERLKKLFEREPFENVIVEKDWSGHDRFLSLKIKGASSIISECL